MSMTGAPTPLDSLNGTIWDAIVVGAGPAGSLAARLLALGGARVLLVEKKRFPRSKVCGACLNGQALAVLRSAGLGSLVTELCGIELDEIQLGFRGRTARLALPEGAVLSRDRLDAALADAATDAGARFLQETEAVVAGTRDGVRRVALVQPVRTIEVEARLVLVAAGFGRYRSERGADSRTEIARGSRIGAGCQVEDAPDSYGNHTIFMAVGRAGYVGVVRMEDGRLNVAAAFEPEFVRRLGTPGAAAAAVLAEAGLVPIAALERSQWQGTARLARRTRPLAEDRLFLLGDAAGYVAPFTGEGIAWALASAQALAPLGLRAIERWDPRLSQAWSNLHWRLVGRRQLVCRAIALVLSRPGLTHLGFEFCRRAPGAAGMIVKRLNAPSFLTNVS
ncbi:MAG: NAD(P)/FAD-dependent oxidoreductase [Isosphaerales bacterium]